MGPDGSPPTELGNQCWQSAGFPIPLLPEDLDLKGDENERRNSGRREGMTEEGECVLSLRLTKKTYVLQRMLCSWMLPIIDSEPKE